MDCVLNSKRVGCGCGGAATRKEVGGKCVNGRRKESVWRVCEESGGCGNACVSRGAYTKEEVLWMLVVEKERRTGWYGGRRWNWSKRWVFWPLCGLYWWIWCEKKRSEEGRRAGTAKTSRRVQIERLNRGKAVTLILWCF